MLLFSLHLQLGQKTLAPPLESFPSLFLDFAFNPGQITLDLGKHSGNGAPAHAGSK